MIIYIKPEEESGVVYTQYSGFIPSDEILRLNNEAFGVIIPEEHQEVYQWPLPQKNKKSDEKVINAWQ
ncbi:MAG: hypothetical protein ACTSSF_11820 [Candidatus Heimdallarchaeaceae archaeon]